MIKRILFFFKRTIRWLLKHNWRVIGGFAVVLTVLEILEALHKKESLSDPFHVVELIVYLFILILVGELINYLLQANKVQTHTMEILNLKHNLSLELTKLEDWETLTSELSRLPSTIADVELSSLYAHNPISSRLSKMAVWKANEGVTPNFYHDCQKCLKERQGGDFMFSPCSQHGSTKPVLAAQAREYCLPINYANHLLALIQFRLKPDTDLSNNQIEIFESIRDEIALALKASQEQKKAAEMKLTEMALAERHSISTFLHDNLSQNLAYLCLKLDQVTQGNEQFPVENTQTEFKRMRDAANLSYEIVRDMIETIYPETTPHFLNLIYAYTKKVSQRADIEISIEKIGKEMPIPPDIQQTIFYIFQEALSNVEKHAQAEKARVLIEWDINGLAVKIKDNGIGFDPQSIDRAKHFGMGIMQERIEKINGHIDIQSSPSSGTELTLFVPVSVSLEKE